MSERNLWELGEKIASNSSMWTRIKNSPKGVSVRGGAKLSNIPKNIAAGGSFMLKQVPIPVVRHILGDSLKKAYDTGKKYHRKKYQTAKAISDEDKTKFGWKDLDVQDMDRYRWKIVDSIKSFNQESISFTANVGKYIEQGNVCDQFVKVTAGFAYSRKRIKKLRDKTLAIRELCTHTLNWLDDVDNQLNLWVQGNQSPLTELAKNIPVNGHEHCDKTVCAVSDKEKLRFSHSKLANGIQMTTSVVAGAFDPMEFFIISQPSDFKVRIPNPYSGIVY
ncbi:hypothetical protein HQQ94_05170 [Shewanella sp. VB17]|uniref:hypothetical protein n=1 Tax=Shewanella sp. VB17 TaxID=2739432 RepID=UPI0015665E0F|nr:hypothetical protein [Shewanella sp. VB17]NRD72646.1 hypothetical protein [Shewanella sp. VB17]